MHRIQTLFFKPIFSVGKRYNICFTQLKYLEIMHDFHYCWDFCVESKVIILIVSDPSFFPNRSLKCPSVCVHGIPFFDRGRVADGQQMGVLPCFLVQILAQAEIVRDCQFVLTACGLQYCVWYSNQVY